MKAGIIDIFAESFGWVLGKTTLYAMAVGTGIGIGACALWAGTAAGSGELRFDAAPGIHQHLAMVTAILPQVLVAFWMGMVFVRSENADAKHWVSVVALEALVMTACFSRAIPGGWLAQFAAWMVAVALIAAVEVAVVFLEFRKAKRGVDHLVRLLQENAGRRAALKEKVGTESAGAEDLGIL